MGEENYYRCTECQGKKWTFYPTAGGGIISATCLTCKGEGVLSDLQISAMPSKYKWFNAKTESWE